MKSIRLLLSLAAFSCLAVAAHATVIIYEGNGKILRGNSVSGRLVPTTLFFVVDFNNLNGNFVFAQTVAGVKSIYDDGPRNYGIAEVATQPTPTVSFTSADGAFVAPNNFQFRGFRMRGKKSKVFLTSNAPLPATIPKTVAGSYSFSAGTPVIIDGTFTLTVDLTRTQFANGNNLSVEQAVGAIINDFTQKKGFTNTAPIP